MTAIDARTTTVVESRRRTKGQLIVKYITSTDHKVIGNLYLVTSFVFFLIAGAMATISWPWRRQ